MTKYFSATLLNGDKIWVETDMTVFPPNVTSLSYSAINATSQNAMDNLIAWATLQGGFPTSVPPPDQREEDIVDSVDVILTGLVIPYVGIKPNDQDATYFSYSSLDSVTQTAATNMTLSPF